MTATMILLFGMSDVAAALLFVLSCLPVIAGVSPPFDVLSGLPNGSDNVQLVIQQSISLHRPDGLIGLPREDVLLDYSIVQKGTSCVRDLSEADLLLFRYYQKQELSKTAVGTLLLLRGLLGAAHECVLGVTPTNLDEAEYAATHRGETTWNQDHPLSDEDDLLHALIHLWEGDARGEGNYTGWDNCKYWMLGGPKKRYCSSESDESEDTSPTSVHAIEASLCQMAQSVAPKCVLAGVVTGETLERRQHSIIAGGGQYRIATLPPGRWNSIAFVDLCSQRRKLDKEMLWELDLLHDSMIKLLLRYKVLKQQGIANVEDLLTPYLTKKRRNVKRGNARQG
jgi:hypothetical protein